MLAAEIHPMLNHQPTVQCWAQNLELAVKSDEVLGLEDVSENVNICLKSDEVLGREEVSENVKFLFEIWWSVRPWERKWKCEIFIRNLMKF